LILEVEAVGFSQSGPRPDVNEGTQELLESICLLTWERSERQSETDWTRLSSNSELVEDDQLSRRYQVSLAAADGIAVATETKPASLERY
jgi:hypothetical protein